MKKTYSDTLYTVSYSPANFLGYCYYPQSIFFWTETQKTLCSSYWKVKFRKFLSPYVIRKHPLFVTKGSLFIFFGDKIKVWNVDCVHKSGQTYCINLLLNFSFLDTSSPAELTVWKVFKYGPKKLHIWKLFTQ